MRRTYTIDVIQTKSTYVLKRVLRRVAALGRHGICPGPVARLPRPRRAHAQHVPLVTCHLPLRCTRRRGGALPQEQRSPTQTAVPAVAALNQATRCPSAQHRPRCRSGRPRKRTDDRVADSHRQP
jgi:hypothetical protein